MRIPRLSSRFSAAEWANAARVAAILGVCFLPIPTFAQDASDEATASSAVEESDGNESDDAVASEATSPSDNQGGEFSRRGEDVTPDEAARILLDELNQPPQSSLRFNFTGASWNDVLDWLATEGDLSLQIDRYPPGTVSFIDRTRTYTLNEALDLLNRLLLDRGHALVRRGRMLFLIDLEMENANKLISELAELVSPGNLEDRGKSDIVTSVFPLGSMTPDEARTQLPELIGPWGRVIILDSARQAKITERAEKLIAIREVIQQSAQEVHEIKLAHRGAEEILQTARPLLGLEAGANSNDDIRISVGLYGDRIYATGLPSKVSILENLVSKADQPLEGSDDDEMGETAKPEFRTHFVRVADVAAVFDVLQTLLQDEPNTRVAIEPSTASIMAYATPAVHDKIDQVIAKMEGSGEDFRVFQLKRIDPAQALLTINKYFGITEENPSGPVVDGDPATGKLWVRGSTDEITQVARLLDELDGASSEGILRGKVRLLPLSGTQAEDALRQLQLYWRMTGRENSIRVVSPGSSGAGSGIRERRIDRPDDDRFDEQLRSEPEAGPAVDIDASLLNSRRFYYLTQAPATNAATSADAVSAENESKANEGATEASETLTQAGQKLTQAGQKPPADILIEVTADGIRIASDDTEALDELEELLSQLIGPMGSGSELPTIFWLKYIQADVASELVASILGGSDTSGGLTDTLSSGLGGGMLGGLMGLAGGGGGGSQSSTKSVLTTTGSVSIVPDLRLNALFIQANDFDMQLIEMILEKIDRQESPEKIELTATPRMIPVLYVSATDVAKIVKEVYADRMGNGDQNTGGERGGRGGGAPSPQDLIAAFRGGGRGGRGNETPTSERTKITVSADTASNSIIVTATNQDFQEILALVESLDQAGKVNEKEMVVYSLSGKVNGDKVVEALSAMLEVPTDNKSSDSSSTSSSDRGNNDRGGDNNDAAERMREALRARFGSGGGGPPGGFRGFGGGGDRGGRGGFGGFGGGRPGGDRGGRGGR
ncbi:secretin N-terminal domain-containing protein [Roseiconus lacunae]|uniref:Secretin N-terminal domain-containing protein n=1 Tax=Roseiconus lacunae TaxID=2605694 RepID=A0ABT7PK73_9BACT|nr:secretin N-terminal domain-containing protein [Roseiconus lacunae]MDM4016889.1 secretin N-terminal domain-containing protein [Roseiconus lacunae]